MFFDKFCLQQHLRHGAIWSSIWCVKVKHQFIERCSVSFILCAYQILYIHRLISTNAREIHPSTIWGIPLLKSCHLLQSFVSMYLILLDMAIWTRWKYHSSCPTPSLRPSLLSLPYYKLLWFFLGSHRSSWYHLCYSRWPPRGLYHIKESSAAALPHWVDGAASASFLCGWVCSRELALQ